MKNQNVPEQLKPDPGVGSSALLAALRRRFVERADVSERVTREAAEKGWWLEAHNAEQRRDIWKTAISMIDQESAANKDYTN